MKRFIAMLLAFVMVFSLIPSTVYATDGDVTLNGKPVDVAENVIDITDNKFASLSSYHATVTNIKIDGANVAEAREDGKDIYIVLSYDTASDASIGVTFGASTSSFTVEQDKNSISLVDGKGSFSVKLTGKYSGRLERGSVTYNLYFSLAQPPTESPECLVKNDSMEVYAGNLLEWDLKDYFEGASDYYIVEGSSLAKLTGSKYSFSQLETGEYTLTFAASNIIGECPDRVTIIVKVKEIEGGIWIGKETGNGAWNYVTFADEAGNPIEGLECSIEGTKILVSLPKDYELNGKIKSFYNLTQNASGLPFITTKTGTTGTSSGRAESNKFTEKTTALSNGAAAFTFYFYDMVPTNRNNVYTTYTLEYAIKNELPVLAEGISDSVDVEIEAGQDYELNLQELFTDADSDELTYKVSVNGEAAVAAEEDYSYTTDIAGNHTLVFTANDGKGDSKETYTVNLNVKNVSATYVMTVNVPESVSPSFYVTNGFGDDGVDVLGDELTAVAGDTTEGITSYTVHYPTNAKNISVRGNESGVAIPASENGTVSLQSVQMKAVNFAKEIVEADSRVSYSNGENAAKAVGKDGNYLLQTGQEYTYTAVPKDTGTYVDGTKTEILTGGISTVEIEVLYKNPKTITVTTGATAQMFGYNQYYSMTEYKAKAVIDNLDGTTTFYFTPEKGPLSYRVSMDGKITKAGYLDVNVGQKWNLTVDYTKEERTPDARVDYTSSSASNSSVGDDSVLVNVNAQNHLQMTEGAVYKLKGYRAWEIIKYSYQNEIITPDFHFDVLSGEDVISLTPVDSNSHSGIGDKSDWVNVKALKEGTAIIEVSYDAIDVAGGSWPGLYGAADPERTGLVVVTVGGADKSVDFGIDSYSAQGSLTFSEKNKKDWDVEFDTLYFTDNHGELKFSPTAGSAISEVAVSNDKGDSWTVLKDDEGAYTANIMNGNNILRVTTADGVAYQVVRGKQIDVSVKEVVDFSDADGLIEAGEKVRVSLNGIYTPIPKMSGNYNPGYKNNTEGDGSVHMVYNFNDDIVSGAGAQYTFAKEANYLEVTIPEDTTAENYILDQGYIAAGIIGLTDFANGGDSHRNIPDAGCGTRGSKTTLHTRSVLPEVEIQIGETAAENQPPTVKENALTESTIEFGQNFAINPETLFSDPDGDALTFTVSVDGSEFEDITTAYQFTPKAPGTYAITFKANDGKAEVSHSITLTVNEAKVPDDEIELEFDISSDEIKGYVTVSFEDFGVRVEGEKGLKYPVPLGTIIEETKVPYKNGDNVADVTLRLLNAMNIDYIYSGTAESGFYLSAIKNFVVNNTPYDIMGEFMAGQGSGWMITLNDVFINRGASDFKVKDGDVIAWKYSCQLGADIGDIYDPDEGGDNPGSGNPGDDGAEKPSVEKIYQTTGDYMAKLGVPAVNSVGGDWMALGLARSGRTVSEKYYKNVVKYVEDNINKYGQLHNYKSSDNSRVILGLTATGHDAANVGGYNLLQALYDIDYVGKQGVNGYFWALIALDSHDYEAPAGLRDDLVEAIMDAQLADGGWALSGTKSNVDMTAMAIQALAPYYETNNDVKEAVDQALELLSDVQNKDGSFHTTDGQTAESCAQVVVALCALDIDPSKDARFIKNDNSVLDALCSFYVEGGGFKHTMNSGLDGMATEQGYYALTAYMRLLEEKTFLYDMSDVTLEKDDTPLHDFEEPKDPEKDSLKDKLEALGSKTSTKSLGKVDETDESKKEKTMEEVKTLLDGISEESKEGDILDAILAYDSLTKDEKEELEYEEVYQELKNRLAVMIQTDETTGIVLEGCEWNIRLVVKAIEDETGLADFEEKLGKYQVLGVWDIYLENVVTGDKYLPDEAIRIKIPVELLEEMNAFDGYVIAHYTDDGKVEYLKCDMEEDYVVFHALDFSYYAVAGYVGEGPEVLEVIETATTESNAVLWIAVVCGMILLAGIGVLARMKKKVEK